MPIVKCDPCVSDWKAKVKELWANYQDVVKVIQLNGERFFPDGNGIVTLESNTDVINNDEYFTLICRIVNATISTLTDAVSYWILTTQFIYEMSGYYDVNESDSFAFFSEGENILIATTG